VSGDGVVTVRMPRLLLRSLESAAHLQGVSAHEIARRVLSRISSLTGDELVSLLEAPPETDNPRISLYVGWQCIDGLIKATHDSRLTTSSVVRRMLYGVLVSDALAFVQENGQWRLKVLSQKPRDLNSLTGNTYAAR
jgi:hypothetical protein